LGVLNVHHSQQQTFLETLAEAYSWKANITAQVPSSPTLSSGPMSDPCCGIVPALHDTWLEALANWTSSLSPVIDPPLLSNGDQWSLENHDIQNLPSWEQELAELCEKQAQLRDQIGVANSYVATRQAKQDRDTEAAAMDEFGPGRSDPQNSQHDLVSNLGAATLVQGSYCVQVTTPSHSSLQESLAESNFDMAMTDASLALTVPKERIESNIPPVPIVPDSSSVEHCLQPSQQLVGGTRRRKRRRLSEKLLPIIHQNKPSMTSTYDHSISNELLDSTAASKQEWKQPSKGHRPNQPSRILLDQLSGLEPEPQNIGPFGEVSLESFESVRSPHSERPASYPQSQRWRRSLGISVKALRDGFERLKII